MKKILIITGENLKHYRVEMYNLLCDRYNITFAHTGNKVDNAKFTQLKIVNKVLGPFNKYINLPDLSTYHTVIFPFNIRLINLYYYLIKPNKFKLLLFGIGVTASYTRQYDHEKRLDFIKRFFLKKSDGAIFYEHYPLIKFQSQKINPNKLFPAYNTVLPPTNFQFSSKTFETFIFIGTLYKQKKIYDLLYAYERLFNKMGQNTPKLEIIGDGIEYSNIKSWIYKNKLTSNVILHGELINDVNLSPIFKRAIVCISPGQAGLSVQKCFSYGIPFVTTKRAITGGELFSIINKTNGFLYDGSIEHLSKIMFDLSSDVYDIKKISQRAFSFYNNFRTPEIWRDAFCDAIENQETITN